MQPDRRRGIGAGRSPRVWSSLARATATPPVIKATGSRP